MGFYITTFLLGGLVAGNASHTRADQPKPADKANVNADNTKQNAPGNVTNELEIVTK